MRTSLRGREQDSFLLMAYLTNVFFCSAPYRGIVFLLFFVINHSFIFIQIIQTCTIFPEIGFL